MHFYVAVVRISYNILLYSINVGNIPSYSGKWSPICGSPVAVRLQLSACGVISLHTPY